MYNHGYIFMWEDLYMRVVTNVYISCNLFIKTRHYEMQYVFDLPNNTVSFKHSPPPPPPQYYVLQVQLKAS